jgi:hypothetical protein
MTRDAGRLLEEALQLAPNERAEIAAELLSSLDEQEQDVRHPARSVVAVKPLRLRSIAKLDLREAVTCQRNAALSAPCR